MTSQVLVKCDGAPLPRGLGGQDWIRLDISSIAASGALNIRIPALDEKLKGNVPAVAADLIRIGAFVYWADQEVDRKAENEVFGQQWNRRFVLAVPVQELGLWERPDVKRALERAVNYGTDDRWEFHFVGDSVARSRFLFSAGSGFSVPPDSILLFSGGTDSFCAAAEEAAIGRRPVLVSHSPSPRVKGHQASLRAALVDAGLGWDFPAVHAEVSKTQNPERERTQRSRGFLYSVIGASVAVSLGIRDVVLADNGFVSIALPVNGQAIAGKMSRTTHPRFQKLFNDLMELIQPGVRIRNPLLYRTRAEILGSLVNPLLREALKHTRSCAAGSRLSDDAPHCGTCSQCIDRRIGMSAAGLAAFDTAYVTDMFVGDLGASQLMLAEAYLRLMRTIGATGAGHLIERFVELSDCATLDHDGHPVRVEQLVEVACRQADAFKVVLENEASRRRATLVSGGSPRNSLFALAVAPAQGETKDPRAGPGRPDLTEVERAEAAAAGLIARVPVRISGKLVNRMSNQVMLGDLPVNLPDSDMTLFMRLVVEAFRSSEGWCSKHELVHEGYSPPDIDNAISRLRRCLSPGLGEIDPKEFIQVNRGRARVSTHRRFIELRREGFEAHPNSIIRKLVSQIPFA